MHSDSFDIIGGRVLAVAVVAIAAGVAAALGAIGADEAALLATGAGLMSLRPLPKRARAAARARRR